MGCNYEKNKRGIGSINTNRIICISIITVLIFSTASVYAASEVIVVAGTGSGVSQFADYNSNTTVANSYIVVDSNVPFSNAFNALSRNIAKLTSTAASSNLYINTTNSYIATLYTYLSNNLPGQWQTLSDIKTNTANSAVATNAALTLISDLDTINWHTLVDGTFIDQNGNAINTQTLVNSSNPNYYFYFNFQGKTDEFAILKLVCPLVSGGRNGNDYTLEFYEINGQGNIIRFPDPKYVYEYDTAGTNLIIYISDYFYNFSNVCVKVIPSYQYYFFGGSANIPKSYYLKSTQSDYLDVSEYIFQRRNMITLNNIHNDLQNITIHSDFDDSDILDAINDLSLTNNNIKVDVNYTYNDAQGVEDIIPFIRNFFDNNISVSDFIDEASEGQNNWFSQTNKNLMENLSGGYVNLYD